MATFYLDWENGNDNNDGTSFANRWRTINNGPTAARTAPGDTIRVMASPDPQLIGNATWTHSSAIVTLASGLTVNIEDCQAAWTASSNVTATATTSVPRYGANSASIAIGASFTTGLAAYRATTSNLDLSQYGQVSLWMKVTAGTNPYNDMSLRLCSDTSGTVSVNTLNLNASGFTASVWYPLTINYGTGNLHSAINSVALYVDNDVGAQTVLLSNIMACKPTGETNNLTLNHYIGKNTAGETFRGIMSISGTRVVLDNSIESVYSQIRGYYGHTETVPTYVRKPIYLTPSLQTTINEAGTVTGNYITYDGGWNRTDMSTQTGETWLESNYGRINLVSRIAINNISIVRANYGFNQGISVESKITNSHVNNCNFAPMIFNTTLNSYISGVYGVGNGYYYPALRLGGSCPGWEIHDTTLASNGMDGINLLDGDSNCLLNNVKCYNNRYGMYIASSNNHKIINCHTSGNTAGLYLVYHSTANCINTLMDDVLETQLLDNGTSHSDPHLTSHNHDRVVNAHKSWFGGMGEMTNNTSVRHTESGYSWKIDVTSNQADVYSPVKFTIGKVYAVSGSPVTVKLWMRRTSTTLVGQLCVPGYQVGVVYDLKTVMTAAANTWEEVSLVFTPTATGVFTIEAQAYGGTVHSLYVDDLTVTQ